MVLRQSPVPLNMLFQQMKSMRSFKIEEPDTQSTPSIAVANNEETPNESSTVLSLMKKYCDVHSTTNNDSKRYLPTVLLSEKPSTVLSCLKKSLYEPLIATLILYNPNFQSQAMRFGFGNKSNYTSLNRLWYTYSYIYKIIIPILVLFVILFMPTTGPLSVVSPEPTTTRRHSLVTMSNYTTKPTSTIIRYVFFVSVLKSLHTSPIYSSAILKHTAPFLPSSLVCPFFVIFSLSTISRR